ncbi:MlaD family protein [Mycolicibacterium komossense]|uniref:MCE family protein n=1 Tax=Mycolicibacterium komossense TaxID=1779 RepID=A0ABT3CFW0_9MYCO|nr:MlaD family protein [Mycolicibacterium komossense]MCV7228368.1 MCE family protein [Mycolicibacterium komossense]
MPVYLDHSGRSASSRRLRVRGLAVGVVLAVATYFLYQQSTGKLDDTFELTVLANSIGEGLAPGAEVKYRGMTIGSVKALESAGYNKQKMTVVLDPRQAKILTTATSARFTSSNVFGTAAVELVSNGDGAPLGTNQTLEIGANVQAASVTGLLRQGQKLSQIIDSADGEHIVNVLRRHADLTEPVAKSVLDFARILADSQTVPFSQSLSVIGSFVNGLNDFVPLMGLINQLLDQLQFLAEPGGADHTNVILQRIGQLINGGGQIFARNNSWLVPLVNGLMNAAIPAAFAVGSLAPAYDRLSGLLDRTSAAFPVRDGKPRLQVELLLDSMPGLAAALPSPGVDPGPTPGPPPMPGGGS